MSNTLPTQQILQFWLIDTQPEAWFTKNDDFDNKLKTQFSEITTKAQQGKYNSQTQTPEQKLALLIVLDQFSRNIYRNSPKSFAGDKQALKIAKELINKGNSKQFNKWQQLFLYLPLEHSENLKDQKKCIELYTIWVEEHTGGKDETEALKYAQLHYDIIEKFGRFPHRNEILGRTSTKEEIEFLKQPNSSF